MPTLLKQMSLVHVGFRPHDLGVLVFQEDGRAYRPEWRLVSDLQVSLDRTGPPEYWCSDRHRIYFDKPADRDYEITAIPEADKPKQMRHPVHGTMTAYSKDEIAKLKSCGWSAVRAKK